MNDFITLLETFAFMIVNLLFFMAVVICTLYMIGLWVETYQLNKKDKK